MAIETAPTDHASFGSSGYILTALSKLYQSLLSKLCVLTFTFVNLIIIFIYVGGADIHNKLTSFIGNDQKNITTLILAANAGNTNSNYYMDCKIYVYNVSQLTPFHLDTSSSIMFSKSGSNFNYFNKALFHHPLRTYNVTEADLFYIPTKTCSDETCNNLMHDIYSSVVQRQGGHIKINNNISNHFVPIFQPNNWLFNP
eukprot:294638_1